MLSSAVWKTIGIRIFVALAAIAGVLAVQAATHKALAAEDTEEADTAVEEPLIGVSEETDEVAGEGDLARCPDVGSEDPEQRAFGPKECCTYKEWTYYAGPAHTTVVGSRTRHCCAHRTYTSGQVTQYCDWIVTGCPDDEPDCPNGQISSGSSNNCSA